MKLKEYEENNIPIEIHKFYDDLSDIYLKSHYEYGIKDDKVVEEEKIGRYLLTKREMEFIDEDVDISFLLFSEEGHIRQDEIVIEYHKNIYKEIEDILELYEGSVFDISSIKLTDGKNIFEDFIENKTITVSLGGLLIASHIFGVRKLRKFFDRVSNYVDSEGVAISQYIDDKHYDLSFIFENKSKKLVVPDITKEDEDRIDLGEEFIGQNNKNLIDQIKDSSYFKEMIQNIKDTSINKVLEELKNTEGANGLVDFLKTLKGSKENETDGIVDVLKSFLAPNNEKTKELIKEKLDNKYKDNYVEYFEKTTNSKVDNKEKKAFNEVLKANKDDMISQKNFDSYRSIDTKKVGIVEYIYDLVSKSIDPLYELERSLSFLSCKYAETMVGQFAGIVKDLFKSKVKNYVIEKINKLADVNLPKEKISYYTNLGLVDVDDIKFSFKEQNLKEYTKDKAYKLLMIFKDMKLVKKSYSLDILSKRVYPRSRRLLDNILLALIKSMTKTSKDFDEETKSAILAMDFIKEGLCYEDFEKFVEIAKQFNYTALFCYLLKNNIDKKQEILSCMSNIVNNKKYNGNNIAQDKERIKSLFKTEESFKYNMQLRSILPIYFYYKDFYKLNDNTINTYFVCDKASVRCTMSSGISFLNVISSKKYINNKACATLKDTNINPFPECKSNKICTPNITKWTKTTDNKIDNEYALFSNSTCNCSFGGVISIVNSNQNSSQEYSFSKEKIEKKYEIDDYIHISNLIYDIKDYAKSIDVKHIMNRLRPKKDHLNLLKDTVIPTVYNDRLVNAYDCIELCNKYKKDPNLRYMILSNLKTVYSPYYIENKEYEYPVWMDRIFEEQKKIVNVKDLEKAVIKYHYIGGGIKADISSAWCSSFACYVIDNGFKTPYSKDFLSSEASKYFKKLKKAKYGAIVVMEGHISFYISSTEKGFYAIGGNQGGVIKKSYFKNTNKIKAYLWPR